MKHYHLSHSDNAFCRVVVTVPFGSGHEPADWPGLAHLLEHCLFLGSHKLEPGTNPALQGRELDPLAAGELQGLMAQAGIRINASTRLEQSCYMLECLPEQLEEAFIRLLQLIYAPVFHPQEVIAEVGIIDGEYQAYCEHPEQQLMNLIQTQVHPDHPFCRLLAGNRVSLGHNGPELVRQLHLAYETGYLSQAASLYIEHPAGFGFKKKAQALYNQLEAIRHDSIHEKNRTGKQSLSTQKRFKKSERPPPLFRHQQHLFSVTHKPTLQWAWPLDNSVISDLLLSWKSLDCLALALKVPDDFRLILAMQWQHQALLIISTDLPKTAGTLADTNTLETTKLSQLQKQIQKSCCERLKTTNSNVQKHSNSPSETSLKPALLKATDTAIQHHYRSTRFVQAEEAFDALHFFQEAILGPPAITLISHPGFSDLPLNYQTTDNFPTDYLTGKDLSKCQQSERDAQDPILVQKLTYPTQPILMPFRTLIQQLAAKKPDGTQQPGGSHQSVQEISLSHSTRLNHAALVWRSVETFNLKSRETGTTQRLAAKLYSSLYEKLRIQDRIGYIVQVFPVSLDAGEGITQDGIAALVQSATQRPKTLLKALRQGLSEQFESNR